MDGWPQDPAQAARLVWWLSLALGLVVSGVVALLLWLIHRSACTINARVSKIWDIGQRVANNTVHIPALFKTNDVVRQILATSVRIDAGAAAIEGHAGACPGCPQCMLKH